MVLRPDVPVRLPDLASGSATCARRCRLDITWRFFSLEEVNRVEGKKHPWERPWSFGWGQMRVGALIRRELGNDARRPLVRGRRSRVLQRRREDARARGARGGDRDGTASTRRSSSARSPTRRRLDDVRADHDDAVAELRRARRADDRVRVGLRGVRARSSCPRRRATTRSRCGTSCAACSGSRTSTSSATRRRTTTSCTSREQFRTYLTTRDWNTVENPAP